MFCVSYLAGTIYEVLENESSYPRGQILQDDISQIATDTLAYPERERNVREIFWPQMIPSHKPFR